MMKINILRGQDQIGGSIIEISTATTRLILDAGVELDEGEQIMIPEIGGLFSGEKAYDAVFVSHYHADHMGLLNHVLKGIPIYMGEKAYRIASAASEYLRREISFVPNFILDEQPITIGDIQLTPISCDHSAFDAYMFLIEVDGKTLLYTGDFRANGRLGDEMRRCRPGEGSPLRHGDEVAQLVGIHGMSLRCVSVFLISHLSLFNCTKLLH